jgi:hypothetical protein
VASVMAASHRGLLVEDPCASDTKDGGLPAANDSSRLITTEYGEVTSSLLPLDA